MSIQSVAVLVVLYSQDIFTAVLITEYNEKSAHCLLLKGVILPRKHAAIDSNSINTTQHSLYLPTRIYLFSK